LSSQGQPGPLYGQGPHCPAEGWTHVGAVGQGGLRVPELLDPEPQELRAGRCLDRAESLHGPYRWGNSTLRSCETVELKKNGRHY